MKVLFQNRSKDLFMGGDIVQMERTAEELRKLGVDVEISDKKIYLPAKDYVKFDIIHLWNFSMSWTAPQMALALLHKKPVVCSMIYHLTDRFLPYEKQQLMADNLTKGIFLNKNEVIRMRKKVKIDSSKIEIIPNGIDKEWFIPYKKGSYVLTAGRIEELKGQLAVAKACKQLHIPYHIVGEIMDENYYKSCIEAGAIYRGKMNAEQLLKEYEGASIVVLASKAELMSLVVMEAGAQAKNIVLTIGSEWKPDVDYCKYDNVASIKKAISKALERKPNYKLRNELKKLTWENTAERLLKIYKLYGK